MQTFVPYRSFCQSARVLDWQRLGKQRVEAKQILQCLESGRTTGWRNHPAVKMWQGWENSLARYGLAMCNEWKRRGYRDTLTEFFLDRYDPVQDALLLEDNSFVPHFITHDFMLSHQSNLIRKAPDHYRPIFGPDVPDDLPYVWPRN